MRQDEARQKIIQQVQTTTQQVVIAKQYLLSKPLESTLPTDILKLFLKQFEAPMPERIVINPATDPTQVLEQAAASISWQVAFHEAVWALVHTGALLPTEHQLDKYTPWIGILEGYPGSGSSTNLTFAEYTMAFPHSVTPSRINDANHALASPDLYLAELNIAELHEDVRASLEEAAQCFRHELYLSAVVMIGKAAEDTWTQLGQALVGVFPRAVKLSDPLLHIGRRVNDTQKL